MAHTSLQDAVRGINYAFIDELVKENKPAIFGIEFLVDLAGQKMTDDEGCGVAAFLGMFGLYRFFSSSPNHIKTF